MLACFQTRSQNNFLKNKLNQLNTGISTGLPCYSPTPREPVNCFDVYVPLYLYRYKNEYTYNI